MAGSYVSLQSALVYYGMIPELVPITTSVTTVHPTTYDTTLGQFNFHHIQISWFKNFNQKDLGNNQWAFIATPEKALLDLIYLQPGGDKEDYLQSLRLQALDQLDMDLLQLLASISNKAKLLRAARLIQHLVDEENWGYTPL